MHKKESSEKTRMHLKTYQKPKLSELGKLKEETRGSDPLPSALQDSGQSTYTSA